jgi:glycosyltransferase involved in cell wall biosynthesis
VIIPVRNRSADRLRATLASLRWQERPPAHTLVVSHGSSEQTDAALEALCRERGIGFERIARASDPWCKPAALNHGIRQTPADVPYVMTLDADMILQPNFLSVVSDRLERAASPGAMVLCRSCDLPETLRITRDAQALRDSFERLRRTGRLRGRQACGGIQAAPRSFFFKVRGYDEVFTWWGEEDRDMVSRAERYGLRILWIEGQTSMLHQWHPHATNASDPRHRRIVSRALERNRELRKRKTGQGLVVCDNPDW